MSNSEQLHRPADQIREAHAAPDPGYPSQPIHSPPSTQTDRGIGGGTDVMGEPVNPTPHSQMQPQSYEQAPGHPSTLASDSYDSAVGAYPSSGGGSYPYTITTPGHSQPFKGNFPSAAAPNFSASAATTNSRMDQTTDNSKFSAESQQPAGNPSPYVQTSSIPGGTGKTPMDSIMQVFNKWSKKAEDMTGNVWNHLRTGPNVADTALGRIAIGTKAMTEGGLENVFRQTFEVAPDECLLKSYACYLSTSTGPVAGTLYISTYKLAFCSDRPLMIPASPTASKQTNQSSDLPLTAQSNTNATQQQQEWCYYKVTVPLSHLESVNPSENMQKKPPEKYVQVKTVDGHEFWFMGFVNYDKGVKNLQDALLLKNSVTASNINATQQHVSQSPEG